ncbi:hypothetical protein ACJX0J_017482, partial [Zea mays]
MSACIQHYVLLILLTSNGVFALIFYPGSGRSGYPNLEALFTNRFASMNIYPGT